MTWEGAAPKGTQDGVSRYTARAQSRERASAASAEVDTTTSRFFLMTVTSFTERFPDTKKKFGFILVVPVLEGNACRAAQPS